MKEIVLIYTGTCSTTVQVPDDFEVTHESLQALSDDGVWCSGFEYEDSEPVWTLDSVDSFMSNIGV